MPVCILCVCCWFCLISLGVRWLLLLVCSRVHFIRFSPEFFFSYGHSTISKLMTTLVLYRQILKIIYWICRFPSMIQNWVFMKGGLKHVFYYLDC